MKDLRTLRVFLSSTSKDLEEYRAVARLAIVDQGWAPEMMEHFSGGTLPTVKACEEKIDRSDLVILIVAWRRGWVPTVEEGGDGTSSITALELAHARTRKLPIFAFVADDSWPLNLVGREPGELDWMEAFRGGLAQVTLPKAFHHEESGATESERLPVFRSILKQALVEYRESLLARQRETLGTPSGGVDYFRGARTALFEGGAIPFVGADLRGGPAPTSRVLAKALCEQEDAEHALATAAEYAERYLGSREILLTQLRHAIEAQAAGDVPAPVHELFSRIENLPLVISATFGMELEKRLAERRRTAVVAHVVRSYQAEHDGKMLVVRPGGAPSLPWADELDLRDAECVIYKPLGSPFLHDGLDPDLGIDTVVVTETDHAAFLARLENKRSGIPTAFSRPLQRRPIVFLGYSLDVWQYRLVLQVFESAGTRGRQASTFAVRQPASAMEELAWKRLGANLIPMDAGAFAARALADASAPVP